MYFSLIRPTGFWIEFASKPRAQWLLALASALGTAALFVTGTAGAWFIWQRYRELGLALIGFALVKPIAIIPFYVETRYRYGLYPLLALFAALFIASAVEQWREEKRSYIRLLVGSGGIFALITFIDLGYSWQIVVTRLSTLFSF